MDWRSGIRPSQGIPQCVITSRKSTRVGCPSCALNSPRSWDAVLTPKDQTASLFRLGTFSKPNKLSLSRQERQLTLLMAKMEASRTNPVLKTCFWHSELDTFPRQAGVSDELSGAIKKCEFSAFIMTYANQTQKIGTTQ